MIGSLLVAHMLLWIGEGTWGQSTVRSESQQPVDLAEYHRQTRESVSQVLEAPEFADVLDDGSAWWLALLQRIERFFSAIAEIIRALPAWLLWVIIAWLVLALLAILAHFVYVLIGVIGGSAARRQKESATKERGELLGIRELDFDSVNRLAREYLASGNWPAATRYLYVSAILWLDRQGWLKFGVSKTNSDYIRELIRQPEYRNTFRTLTNRFESTVYGGNACTANNCQEMASLVDKLLRETIPVVAI